MTSAPSLPAESCIGISVAANPNEVRDETGSVERALIPAPAALSAGDVDLLDPLVARIPVELDVAIPLNNFRVCNLLALEPGRVIESSWSPGDDLPLAAGKVQLAWTEFEVINTTLGVRITRLA